jgi:hypothetical protein
VLAHYACRSAGAISWTSRPHRGHVAVSATAEPLFVRIIVGITFCLVKTTRNATIRTTGPTQSTIDVVGDFRLSNGGFFGPDVGTPPPAVRVAGTIMRTSAATVLQAFVSAPNAVISIGRTAVVQGAFCAARARTDKNITLGCLASPRTTSTTTIPPSCGAAETAGMAKFPTKLPVQSTCKKDTSTNADGCNDWKVIGAAECKGEEELAVPPRPARFYLWEDNATETTCYYLYRGRGTAETANGVHCYFSDCYVCAWDIHCWATQKCNGADEKTAVWDDLKPADGSKGNDKSSAEEFMPIEDCSTCHAPGPMAPMSEFFGVQGFRNGHGMQLRGGPHVSLRGDADTPIRVVGVAQARGFSALQLVGLPDCASGTKGLF